MRVIAYARSNGQAKREMSRHGKNITNTDISIRGLTHPLAYHCIRRL